MSILHFASARAKTNDRLRVRRQRAPAHAASIRRARDRRIASIFASHNFFERALFQARRHPSSSSSSSSSSSPSIVAQLDRLALARAQSPSVFALVAAVREWRQFRPPLLSVAASLLLLAHSRVHRLSPKMRASFASSRFAQSWAARCARSWLERLLTPRSRRCRGAKERITSFARRELQNLVERSMAAASPFARRRRCDKARCELRANAAADASSCSPATAALDLRSPHAEQCEIGPLRGAQSAAFSSPCAAAACRSPLCGRRRRESLAGLMLFASTLIFMVRFFLTIVGDASGHNLLSSCKRERF